MFLDYVTVLSKSVLQYHFYMIFIRDTFLLFIKVKSGFLYLEWRIHGEWAKCPLPPPFPIEWRENE